MKDKDIKQEQINQFYKNILRDVGGVGVEKTLNELILALEKSTGLKVSETQRQYLENYASSTAMKWANVLQNVSEGLQDPKIMREYQKKAKKG